MTQCHFCYNTLGAKSKYCSSCGNPKYNLTILNNEKNILKSSEAFKTQKISDLNLKNLSQNDLENKILIKPIKSSINSIIHTLFVLPEYFIESLNEILNSFGVENYMMIDSKNGSCVVERCQQFIRNSKFGSIQYVCIIGNWNEVPPLKVPNNFGLDDGDEFCISDAFFGAIQPFNPNDPFTAIPDIPVGRIPIADRDIVQRVLGSDPELSPTHNSFQFGVTAQCWEVASKEIISSFPNLLDGAPHEPMQESVRDLQKCVLFSSPIWTEKELRRVAYSGPKEHFGLIYFNVHGGADDPEWVGEALNGGYVRIFEPGTINDFKSALLVSEACYGGAMSYDSISIVEHFFLNRGLSFVGSSTIAYGARTTPISAADLIAKYYILGLYGGLTYGEALKLAKFEALAEDPLSLEYAFKTVLSFNLFGAPWQRLVSLSTSKNMTRSLNQQLLPRSVINRVRSNIENPNDISNYSINKTRDQYRSRLPAREKQFIIKSSEILKKLREFKDYSKLLAEFYQSGTSADDLRMDFVSAGNKQGYRLICPTNSAKNGKNMLIFITDINGHVIKTLVTKGIK